MKQKLKLVSLNLMAVAVLALVAGCAFDISHVKQQPVTYTAVATPAQAFVLSREIKATMGTGYPTRLKAGTRWYQVGNTEHGAVFGTKDQVVTVEASNNYEAQLVVADGFVKGFYLPVERSFVTVSSPIRLETQPINPNQP